ncbi:hypothetical protein D9M71_564130 [compost metagenome]
MLDQDRLAAPARRFGQGQEHLLQRRQLAFGRLAKQRHQQHTLQPVHGDLLQPRPAAPAAMEQAAGFARRRVKGGEQVLLEGIDHGSHGHNQLAKGAHSTLPGPCWQAVRPSMKGMGGLAALLSLFSPPAAVDSASIPSAIGSLPCPP